MLYVKYQTGVIKDMAMCCFNNLVFHTTQCILVCHLEESKFIIFYNVNHIFLV